MPTCSNSLQIFNYFKINSSNHCLILLPFKTSSKNLCMTFTRPNLFDNCFLSLFLHFRLLFIFGHMILIHNEGLLYFMKRKVRKAQMYFSDGVNVYLNIDKWHLLLFFQVPVFSDAEYNNHLTAEGWTRAETDHLLDLCSRFDIRFPVIHDRWDRNLFKTARTIEDLKGRYYGLCEKLETLHADPSKVTYVWFSFSLDFAILRFRVIEV